MGDKRLEMRDDRQEMGDGRQEKRREWQMRMGGVRREESGR